MGQKNENNANLSGGGVLLVDFVVYTCEFVRGFISYNYIPLLVITLSYLFYLYMMWSVRPIKSPKR